MFSFSASIKFSQELCAKLWMNVENNCISQPFPALESVRMARPGTARRIQRLIASFAISFVLSAIARRILRPRNNAWYSRGCRGIRRTCDTSLPIRRSAFCD